MLSPLPTQNLWLALMIGNSRLHWALFEDVTLHRAWNTEHLPVGSIPPWLPPTEVGTEAIPPWSFQGLMGVGTGALPLQKDALGNLQYPEILIASVVPEQAQLWQTYPAARFLTLDQIPLYQTYTTFGVDRALALWGAGETWGWPALVIDAGTALTLTGADADRQLVGGAILPGLGLQLQSLGQKTAALPSLLPPDQLPSRWATTTPDAIASGIIYTLIAGIQDFITDWWQQFPGSAIALTGGDASVLLTYLQDQAPDIAAHIRRSPHLIFQGMQFCRGRG
ncbi:MAG: pantothenate kinase [Leptolyngbyaceae bacterium]|nr:pantothenate kinase [Leptolyngbyaceae bacterium]